MIYLDNAATSFPKPEAVYEAIDRLSRSGAGNPGRAMHRFAASSESAIQEARRAVMRLLGARDPEHVVFTLNATDALNMALKGALRPGDHAITTDLEHNSVSRPLEGLARSGTITLTRLRSGDDGRIDPGAVAAAMTERTRVVAICHASNVIGVLQDAEALARVAHEAGALLVLDVSQSAGIVPIDVERMGIDLCAFTGHKALLGPMGTGGLVLRGGVTLSAWREGGTGGDSTSPIQPLELPHHLEGGTPNAVGLAGLGAGIDSVLDRGVAEIARHERALAGRLAAALESSPRIRIAARPLPEAEIAAAVGGDVTRRNEDPAAPAGARSHGSGTSESTEVAPCARGVMGLVAFTMEGYQPSEVAAILDQDFGVAVRAGLHCAPYIHRRRGLFPGGTVRASAGLFTTEAEIDEAARAILEVAGA